jgi:hypothetical protein
MTTIKYLQATATVAFISMITLSILMSCSDTKKKSTTDETTVVEQKKTKAPDVDLHTATFFANLAAVKQHIEAGSDLNKKDQYGSTALHSAATFGRTDIAISLINADADLSIKMHKGQQHCISPLFSVERRS